MDDLIIEGTLNFRAVAPYKAAAGRLKPRAIYRSGAFDGIAGTGADGLRRIGVRTAFDLRSDTEKRRRPSPLLSIPDFVVVSEPHDIRHGDLSAVLANPMSTTRACAEVMKGIYTKLPADFTTIYRRYFRAMTESETPVVVHCTAGKDRTGVAIAMLLDLLGVSRDDIMEDYLRTNAAREALRRRLVTRNQGFDFGEVADHLIGPVISADADYLDAMFSTIARDFGDTAIYAARALQLSRADIETLARRFVE